MRGAPQPPPAAASYAGGPVVSAAPEQKSPGLALVLSLVIPTLALCQFYNNDWKKGLAMLLGSIILGPFTAGVASLGIWIWSMIDAYNVAKGTGKRW